MEEASSAFVLLVSNVKNGAGAPQGWGGTGKDRNLDSTSTLGRLRPAPERRRSKSTAKGARTRESAHRTQPRAPTKTTPRARPPVSLSSEFLRRFHPHLPRILPGAGVETGDFGQAGGGEAPLATKKTKTMIVRLEASPAASTCIFSRPPVLSAYIFRFQGPWPSEPAGCFESAGASPEMLPSKMPARRLAAWVCYCHCYS